MKKLVFPVLLLLIAWMSSGWKQEKAPVYDDVKTYVLAEIDRCSAALQTCLAATKPEAARASYHEARKHYKHVEFFIEYVSPRAAKYFINGPLVPRYDEEQGRRALPPNGFQKMEEALFAKNETIDTAAAHAECRMLLEVFGTLKNYYSTISLSDGLALEMCQYELYRIAALNLAGFDATITKTNLQETGWCFEGMEQVCGFFQSAPGTAKHYKQLKSSFAAARKRLAAKSSFDTFDRLRFITECMLPLNKSLVAFHDASGISWSTNKQPLDLRRPFLFGGENFNLHWFSAFYEDAARLQLQVELGRKLFYDPLLSGNNERSCSGCHDPAKGFADGLAKSLAIDGKRNVARNAPTLINVIFQKSFFYDGRVFHLEQQVTEVLANPDEMQSSLDNVVTKLRADKKYRTLFAAAFAGTPDSSITSYAVQKAIAEYEKTLVSFNSPFDRYLRGETQALTEREINGYNLFEGKALCGSCHFMPLFNGTAPPFFSDSEFEVIGVPGSADERTPDADSGRYRVTRIPEQLHAFKTPTVRNVSLTAPYMHNGIYTSLDSVVSFYHKGGGAGLGLHVPNQTLPFDSLQLTLREREDLVLFMKSLTDPAYVSPR